MKITILKTTIWGIFLCCAVLFAGCNNTEAEEEDTFLEGWEQDITVEQGVDDKIKTVTSSTNMLKITGSKVNIRNKASLKSSVINQVNTGEVFEIKGKTETEEIIGKQTDFWYKIEKDGESAWVFGAFTSKNLNDNEQTFTGIFDGTEQGDYFYIHFKEDRNGKEYSFDFGEGGEDNNFGEYNLVKEESKYKGKTFEVTWKVKSRSTYAGEGSMDIVKREVPIIVNLKLIK